MAVDPDFVLTFLIRNMVQKIGVSAVKIKFMIFILFIFRMLENISALNLRGVTSQDTVCSFQVLEENVIQD